MSDILYKDRISETRKKFALAEMKSIKESGVIEFSLMNEEDVELSRMVIDVNNDALIYKKDFFSDWFYNPMSCLSTHTQIYNWFKERFIPEIRPDLKCIIPLEFHRDWLGQLLYTRGQNFYDDFWVKLHKERVTYEEVNNEWK